MTATVIPHEHLRERREVRRLEAIVKANNIPRIGLVAAPITPCAVPDTRAWNIESSYYGATTTQVRSQFEGLKAVKSRPIKAWGHKLISFVGYAFIFGAAIVCLAVRL